MLIRLRRAMTFANVCSFLALTIALGTGTAYAANTVFSTDIVNGEVKTVDIHSQAVTVGKLHADAVTGAKVVDGSLEAADLGTGSVGSDEIADETVGAADIATDAVNATEIADNSIDTGEIVDDSLFSSDLGPASVGTSELASNAVTGAKVANESLTLSDLLGVAVNGAVSLSGIPNGRCSTVLFSVGGAQVGQVPLVTNRAAIQKGIIMYGLRVSSAGLVEVAACNLSGGAMTPISNFPVRIITFG
ncbi:MAG TPA: hypothetical protein VID47_15120 [Actinomycetota bacterium]